MMLKSRAIAAGPALLLAAGLVVTAAPVANAAPLAGPVPAAAQPTASAKAAANADPFFDYDGSRPLAEFAPGELLKTRTIAYHVAGIPLPVTVEQLLYRSTNLRGEAVANATSVIKPAPPTPLEFLSPLKGRGKLVSYQSAYNSLNPEDGPSRAIAGDFSLGNLVTGSGSAGAVVPTAEGAILVPLLKQGYTVAMPDTEGPAAEFGTGAAYGRYTLDALRAAYNSPKAGLNKDTKTALIGYSGGAIGTNWTAALAPTYAPDVNKNLVGATSGGLLVAPVNNLEYVSGTPLWAGIAPMAVKGVSRALGIDLTPYLNDRGVKLFNQLENASVLVGVPLGSGVTWADLAKPEYSDPLSVPAFVEAVNKVNLGLIGSPTTPIQTAMGGNGVLEGTPGFGTGDGVMLVGDIRSLARQYCAAGTPVEYTEHPLLSHAGAAIAWYPGALSWINDRFAGKAAPNNCAGIAPGNPLVPAQVTR